MNVHTYAKKLLFSTQLTDKLFSPTTLTYEPFTGLSKAPSAPGRPKELQFNPRRTPFPSSATLETEEGRGIALHFFANHELLAIELMALFILRFPDMPLGLQKGVTHIIQEEQEHLRLYLRRSKELGIHLGAVGVNQFFWKSLSPMQQPMEFLSGMSLTFEQANLDHCLYYGNLFHQIGDKQTASILRRVYLDEIRHLRHGKYWSRKISGLSLWDAHQSYLLPPLSLARAKGKIFDREGRKKAGLSDKYIERLQIFSHSKGRVPNVYLFNPNVELELYHNGPLPKAAQMIEENLETLPIFLAKKDDIVLVKKQPSSAYLQKLNRLGFPLPQVSCDPSYIEHRSVNEIRAWGKSPVVQALFPQESDWKEQYRKLYTKSYGSQLLKEFLVSEKSPAWLSPLSTVGISCTSQSELETEIARLQKEGHETVLIKGDLGASGRNAIRFRGEWEKGQKRWLERCFMHQKRCVVEPQLKDKIDFSIQIEIQRNGFTSSMGYQRFFTNARGQYLGHWLGPFHRYLPKGLMRFLHEHQWKEMLKRLVEFIGSSLQQENYFGPVGLDALIYRDQGRWIVRPIVEINPRHTMGRVALSLGKRCARDALFYLAKEEFSPLVPFTQSQQQFMDGHERMTPQDRAFGAFLMVGTDRIESWLLRNQLWNPHETL